jgi:hypothetical protein
MMVKAAAASLRKTWRQISRQIFTMHFDENGEEIAA